MKQNQQSDSPLKPKLLGTFLLGVYLMATMPVGAPQELNGVLGNLSLSVIEETTLLPIAPIPVKPRTLTSLMDKIVECESKNDPNACNTCEGTEWEGLYDLDNCPCGAGLGGIIPSTLKYCEERLGRELDPMDSEDNLECSWWLLENEGTDHWEQSKQCWKNI